ncbi:hypothetical protein ABZ617_17020 [Nocardiopsis alba]
MRTIGPPHASTTGLDTSAGFGEEVLLEGYVDRWRELECCLLTASDR